MLTALTFVMQPTNIRFGGIAISIVLIGVCVCLILATHSRNIDARGLIYWMLCAVLLFAHDIQDNQNPVATTKAWAFLILSLFAIVCLTFSISSRWLVRIWQSVALACLLLALIALARFVFGYEEIDPESVADPLIVKDRYNYIGISYLPATRNSEAFYFGIGFLVSIWLARNVPRLRIVFLASIGVCGIALVGALSRGAWVAAFVAVALAYSPPFWFYLLPLSGAAALMFINTSNLPMLNLLKLGVISLFNPDLANENVYGFYTYSNESRLILYGDALLDVLSNPFGIGFSGESAFADFTAAGVTHSENMYLDILLAVGWIGALLPIMLSAAIRAAFNRDTKVMSLVVSVLTFAAVFCLFNGGVDFAFMWYCAGIALVTIASDKGNYISASLQAKKSLNEA